MNQRSMIRGNSSRAVSAPASRNSHQTIFRKLAFRAAAAAALLIGGLAQVTVSWAQVSPVPPGGQTFTLNCSLPNPDPDLVFYLDDLSGDATVQISGINAGGSVEANADFAINGGGNGSISVATGGFSKNKEILNNGNPSKTFTASGATSPRTLVFDKTPNANIDKVTVSCGSTGAAALSIEKAANETSYSAVGNVLTYSIVVRNTGNLPLTGLTVTDTLDPTVDCGGITSLAVGASVNCSASYTIQSGDLTKGSVTNTATADSDQTEPQSDSATVLAASGEPDFTIVKTPKQSSFGAAGDVLEYDIVVTNTGNVPLTGLTVTDTLDPTVDCGGVTSLAIGANVTCSASYTVQAGDVTFGSVTNTAEADTDQTDPKSDSATVVLVGGNPGLSVEKTANQSSFDEVGDVLTYSILVTNTGNLPLTGLTVTDTLDPTVDCGGITSLAVGASVDCSASYTIQSGDLTKGSVTNTATADSDQTGPQSDSVTVKADVDKIVEEEFESLSYNFIAQRLSLIASNGPRLAWLVNRIDGGFGGGGNSFNVTSQDGAISGDFAFNSGALSKAVAGERVMPTADTPRSDGGVNAWVEGKFALYNDDREDENADGDFFIGYAGIDFEVYERVNIGIMGEIDWMNENGDEDGDVEGTGWMIGPYLSAEIADGVFLDMRAMGGRTSNSISQEVLGVDYDGDFDTARWLAEATLSGNYELDSVTLTPDIRLLHIRENQEDYDVSGSGNSVEVDGHDVVLTQLSSGLRISHLITTDDMMVRPYIAGRLYWNIDNPGELTVDGEYVSTDDVTGGVTVGLDAGSGNMQFEAEASYDGLFGDDYAISARVGLGYRF